MELDMFKRLCQDFIDTPHPIKEIDIIMSGGEPLTHPEFPEFVKYLRSIGHDIRLSSNGLLIPEYIHLFQKRDGIQVSIDGDQETHDHIRGKGVYDHAVNALRMLNEANIDHSVTMALCQENIHCINSIIDLCKDTGTHTFNITLFQPHPGTTLKPLHYSEWVDITNKVKLEHPDMHIPTTCIQKGCIAGILGLSVLPDGTYWDCSRNQEVIGKYPEPISKCLHQEHIDNKSVQNPFDTCCKNIIME